MFLYIFLIILAVWIVPRIVRGYLFVHRIRKQARSMYEQMYNTAGPQPGNPTKRRPGWSAPAPRRKKIDPEIGEYVKFQEIAVTETDTARSEDTTYTVEQQVSDAVWEDIKQ